MRDIRYKEEKQHGLPDFPVQYYHVTKEHPRYEMSLHWHRELEIVRVLEGSLELHLDNCLCPLSAGDIAFVGGGVLHRAAPQDCVYECVVFDPTMLCKHGSDRITAYVLPLLSGEIEVRPVTGDAPLARAVAALFEALQREEDYFELRVYSALADILYLLYAGQWIRLSERHAHAGNRRQVMTALLQWIEENYTERITLEQLARVSKTNEKYLCRFFKEYTGNSPIDYINRMRVERACLKMTKEHRNITEAAFDSGFNDISYFSKIFKRYKGMTPREYRRQFEIKKEFRVETV